MIQGQIVLRRFGFAIAEQPDAKVLVLKDMDSGLMIQIPMTLEEFDKFAASLRAEKIIQATVIPHEQIKTIEKIREG